MSGIVGIIRLDGAPVDAPLLQRMTDSLAFRGPDAQRIWLNGAVGLGHTMLRATAEAVNEVQPCSLDEEFWITADARVDDRAGLIGKLQASGRSCSSKSTDTELILHAYAVWGEACVEHLLGDFAFAIWDVKRKCLFCARDQFGVKPFFYARTASSFIFSNTLNCLRLHPEVSEKLNDLAIADFLIFDFNQDPATTAFADILSLPPGHALRSEANGLSVYRYWTLPVPDEIRYKRPAEYLEHFDQLMSAAVGDRLRVETAGVLMSGGLDSTVVAAHAQRIFKRAGEGTGLHAYTEVFDHLFPHDERRYAGLVAEALGIPIHYRSGDAMKLYEIFDDPEFNWPEPTHLPWGTSTLDLLREIAPRSRVALTGQGADPALLSSVSSHFRALLHGKQFGRALGDLLSYLTAERRFSRLYLRTRWRILFRQGVERPWFPSWLNEELEKRHNLRDRWNGIYGEKNSSSGAVRPASYDSLIAPFWPHVFAGYDTFATGFHLSDLTSTI